MNKTNYKQYDTRWAKLGYPKSPYFIKDCGCGEVSIANCIIEMEKYKNETPKTIRDYCVQFAAPNGEGTYFSGIPKMMKHYGMTEVQEHQTMAELWKELAKGDRVAIYLMGNRKGGSKGVHWTSGAHFVCSVGYKVKDDKHYVYVKDPDSSSTLRNGWITYEENMRNDVSRVWSGKLAKATPKKTVAQIAQEVIDGKWGNGDERVKKLKEAGYDPTAVQKKVNEILAPKTVSKNEKITSVAKSYCGSKTKPTASYKSASASVYGKGNDTNCHRFVGTVLYKCGFPKMNISGKTATAWKNILAYLKKNATQVKTAKAGDICVWWKGGNKYHIFIVVGNGKKAEAAHGKTYPHIASYNPKTKHKKDWIFRMK